MPAYERTREMNGRYITDRYEAQTVKELVELILAIESRYTSQWVSPGASRVEPEPTP